MKSKVIAIGQNKFESFYKPVNGRMRQFLRCLHQEPVTGRRCTFERRGDSIVFQKQNGVHTHTYDIRWFHVEQIIPKEKEEIATRFVEFISKSNISLRKSTSKKTIELLNACIDYGYSLGLQNKELQENDYWDISDRKRLRAEVIKQSQKYYTETMKRFRNGLVSLSIDSATFNHKSIASIIAICSFPNKPVETLLIENFEMPSSEFLQYKQIVSFTLNKLKNEHNLSIVSIVSDGFHSQRAAFDNEKRTSLQNEPGVSFDIRKILYVYCRCHLVNLALSDLLANSKSMDKCHKLLIQISKLLRKTENRRILNAICPEAIATRFCYDYRIIKFILKHMQKIESLDIFIDPAIYVYGVLVEQLWKLIGFFEERNATLANSYGKILMFYNDLNRIEAKSMEYNQCLYKNAKLLKNIVKNRLSQQYALTLLAYSLTKEGRNYFCPKTEELEQQQQETGIIEDFFFNSVINNINYENEEENSEMSSERDGLLDYEYDDSSNDEITFEEDELDELIEKYEHKNTVTEESFKRKGIIYIANEFITDFLGRSGWPEEKINNVNYQYQRWMSLDFDDLNFIIDDSNQNLWYLMSFSVEWKELAEFALIITSIPASEVENERVFNIKRNIIGKHCTRINLDLLTARARLAWKE